MKIQSINAYNKFNSYKQVKDFNKNKNVSLPFNSEFQSVSLPYLSARGIDISFRKNVNVTGSQQIDNSNNEPTVKDYYNKIQEQLNPITTKEVEKIVESVENKGVKNDEALYALQSLTQFGNIQSLVKLGQHFLNLRICDFYKNQKVSSNSTFRYLYNDKYFELLDGTKTAYILDEPGLKYLEKHPKKANKIINNDDIVFINLEGWNQGANIYKQGKDNEYLVDNATKITNRAYEIQSAFDTDYKTAFDTAVNEDVLTRAKKIGINDVITLSVKNEEPSVQSIKENLLPMNVTEEFIDKAFNVIAEVLYPDDKTTQAKAKQLITSYFYSESEVFSPQRLGESLKTLHNMILDFAKNHKKSDGKSFKESDIVYIIPQHSRSYDQIAMQYATVNDIPLSRFKNNEINEDNKIYVILDDVIGSGNNMLSKDFNYEKLKVNPAFKNYHIVMAHVTANQAGIDNINREIKKQGRENKDVVIVPPKFIKPKLSDSKFYKNLPLDSKAMMLNIFSNAGSEYNDGLGYERAASAFLFPYMGPDNNSTITSYIFQKLVPSVFSLKSRYYKFGKEKKIVSKIDQIENSKS